MSAGVAFVALAAWPALSGLPTRLTGLLATGVLSGLLVWLATQLGGGSVLGLSERMAAGAQALWPLLVVVASRRAR